MTCCAPKKSGKGAFVYLLHDSEQDLFKIGYSENPIRRFKQISDANNNYIELIGYIVGSKTNEAILHRRFKAYRRKLEWFDSSLDIIEYFKEHPTFVEFQRNKSNGK
jgi:hypothetical protein